MPAFRVPYPSTSSVVAPGLSRAGGFLGTERAPRSSNNWDRACRTFAAKDLQTDVIGRPTR
jgi:hypothetical protein